MNKPKIIMLCLVLLFVSSCSFSDNAKPNNLDSSLLSYHNFLLGVQVAYTLSEEEIAFDGSLFTGNYGISRFALFDINDDGIPELHLMGSFVTGYLIFTMKNDKVTLIYEGTSYESVVNSGAILYKRDGANDIKWFYREIDFETMHVSSLYAEAIDETHDGTFDRYFVEGKEVSTGEWEKFENKFLLTSDSAVEWIDYLSWKMTVIK